MDHDVPARQAAHRLLDHARRRCVRGDAADDGAVRRAEPGVHQARRRQLLDLPQRLESNLGEGVDADGVTLDEKDRMRDKVEFAFKESLKSSRYGWFREVSTPTLPNRGIDVPFRASDQQVWMVKCEKCNEWQEIDWKENIVAVKDIPLGCKELPAESYDFLCRKQKCRGKLDRVYTGQWVARFPTASTSVATTSLS